MLHSDISSSPTPPELSRNTEASKTNVSNETVTADEDKDSNGKIPSTEVEKKYDDGVVLMSLCL